MTHMAIPGSRIENAEVSGEFSRFIRTARPDEKERVYRRVVAAIVREQDRVRKAAFLAGIST